MRVMVIVSDQRYSSSFDPFPPVGTKGTVAEGPDEFNEYEVLFDDWPPASLIDPEWTVHKSMIVFIDGDAEKIKEKLSGLIVQLSGNTRVLESE